MLPRPTRYQVDIPVACSTTGSLVSNRVTNISEGGLFIESARPLPVHADVDLAFTLPDSGATILATGRVIWNCDVAEARARILPGSGVKFVDMAPGDRALLEACLEMLGASQSPSTHRQAKT